MYVLRRWQFYETKRWYKYSMYKSINNPRIWQILKPSFLDHGPAQYCWNIRMLCLMLDHGMAPTDPQLLIGFQAEPLWSRRAFQWRAPPELWPASWHCSWHFWLWLPYFFFFHSCHLLLHQPQEMVKHLLIGILGQTIYNSDTSTLSHILYISGKIKSLNTSKYSMTTGMRSLTLDSRIPLR